MIKGRIVTLSLLILSLALALSGCEPTKQPQEKSTWEKLPSRWKEVPEMFQLDSSKNFDKEEIKKWAEKYGWKKAYVAARGTFGETSLEENKKGTLRAVKPEGAGQILAILYTPLFSWVEAHYLKREKSWIKEDVEDRYRSYTSSPETRAYIECRIGTPVRSIYENNELRVEKDNIKFVLENKDGNRWEASVDAEARETNQMFEKISYSRVFNLWFYFRDRVPNWEELTLHVIREKIGLPTRSLTWSFENKE